MSCDAAEFYDRLVPLLQKLSDGKKPKAQERVRLKKLLDKWDSIECPGGGCTPDLCPYARSPDWVTYHGYPTLYDLINYLDQSRPINEIIQLKAIDMLNAHWARRPGHYNP